MRKDCSGNPPIFSDSRVEVIPGNLTRDNLGVTKHDTQRILDEADAVIHNIAGMSPMKMYALLRHTNVAATKHLPLLAAPHRIPFHYVSCASVMQLA